MDHDALALVELTSVARGLRALDALVKRSPVEILEANLVEPGRYLILFAGGVAEVDEGYQACLDMGSDCVSDKMFLSLVHPALLAGIRGHEDIRGADELDTLGVIEGSHIPATLEACDRSLKNADVSLAGVRLSGGLGGRAYYIIFGAQHDVEAAIEIGQTLLASRDAEHRVECIPRPHEEMVIWLLRQTPFRVSQRRS